jgi:hypothetical protein
MIPISIIITRSKKPNIIFNSFNRLSEIKVKNTDIPKVHNNIKVIHLVLNSLEKNFFPLFPIILPPRPY